MIPALVILSIACCLASSCTSSNTIEQSVADSQANTARWKEKQRWMDYMLDTIHPKIMDLQLQLLTGQITDRDAFIKLTEVTTTCTRPFYTN